MTDAQDHRNPLPGRIATHGPRPATLFLDADLVHVQRASGCQHPYSILGVLCGSILRHAIRNMHDTRRNTNTPQPVFAGKGLVLAQQHNALRRCSTDTAVPSPSTAIVNDIGSGTHSQLPGLVVNEGLIEFA